MIQPRIIVERNLKNVKNTSYIFFACFLISNILTITVVLFYDKHVIDNLLYLTNYTNEKVTGSETISTNLGFQIGRPTLDLPPRFVDTYTYYYLYYPHYIRVVICVFLFVSYMGMMVCMFAERASYNVKLVQ